LPQSEASRKRVATYGAPRWSSFLTIARHVVSDEENLTEKLHRAAAECADLSWRVHDLVIIPVLSLENAEARKNHG
jgi:hypothetical protein